MSNESWYERERIKRFKYYIQACFLLHNVKDCFFFPSTTNLCGDQRLPFNKKNCIDWILLLGFLHPINKYLCPMNLDMRERESFIRLCMVRGGSTYFANKFVVPLMWFGDWIGGLEDSGAEKEEGGREGLKPILIFFFF